MSHQRQRRLQPVRRTKTQGIPACVDSPWIEWKISLIRSIRSILQGDAQRHRRPTELTSSGRAPRKGLQNRASRSGNGHCNDHAEEGPVHSTTLILGALPPEAIGVSAAVALVTAIAAFSLGRMGQSRLREENEELGGKVRRAESSASENTRAMFQAPEGTRHGIPPRDEPPQRHPRHEPRRSRHLRGAPPDPAAGQLDLPAGQGDALLGPGQAGRRLEEPQAAAGPAPPE